MKSNLSTDYPVPNLRTDGKMNVLCLWITYLLKTDCEKNMMMMISHITKILGTGYIDPDIKSYNEKLTQSYDRNRAFIWFELLEALQHGLLKMCWHELQNSRAIQLELNDRVIKVVSNLIIAKSPYPKCEWLVFWNDNKLKTMRLSDHAWVNSFDSSCLNVNGLPTRVVRRTPVAYIISE